MNEVIRILKTARRSVETSWGKGAYRRGCVMGAVYVAGGLAADCFVSEHTPAIQDAEIALQRALPRGWGSVIWFNDDEKTTRADVLALIDRAIAAQRLDLSPFYKILEEAGSTELVS